MPNRIFVINTVRKIHTRYARVTSPTKHKFSQIICDGAIRVNRNRWKQIPEFLFEKYKASLLQLMKEGKIEIRLNSPQGALYSETTKPVETIEEKKDTVIEVKPPIVETVIIEEKILPIKEELLETQNIDNIKKIEQTTTIDVTNMTKAELVEYLADKKGLDKSKLVTYSVKKLRELV